MESEGLEWVPEDQAKIVEGHAPDVFECRPLNSDECFRIIQATQKDSVFLCYAAMLGVTQVESGGQTITEHKEIKAILDNAQNMTPIMALAQTIFQVSREGLDVLPFRHSRSSVE